LTIDCATLSRSELPRPFNRPYIHSVNCELSDKVIGQGSLLIHPLTCWLKAVFLVNSWSSHFFAPFRASFSRTYRGILPSSLRIILPSP